MSEEDKQGLIMEIGFEEHFVDRPENANTEFSRSTASKSTGSAASSSTPHGGM